MRLTGSVQAAVDLLHDHPGSASAPCRSESTCIADPREKEDDMGFLASLGQFFVGIGVLLLGVAAIWFVSVYDEKKE